MFTGKSTVTRRTKKMAVLNSHPAVRTDFYASPVGSPADAASPMQRVARWLRRLWRAYWRYKAHRAAVVILPSLDDRTLRDIGLTRHIVHTAMFGTAADRVHLHDVWWRGGTRADLERAAPFTRL
jgi:uncharacterized protein YjiS (DUF1127 family)